MTPSDSPGPKIEGAQLSFTGIELYRFEISIGCNAKLQLLNDCYGNRDR